MSFANSDDAVLRALLQQAKTIAVAGLSPQPDRPSYRVARAMQGFGFRIVPARRGVREVLQEQAYASLADIPC
ncbi:MAG: CoA-binding protein, partial [Anaerolineales bacterium]